VLAEFAIAFMPICTIFLVLCQLARLELARLAVMHAAMVSVRACAVIIEPDPGFKDGVDGKEDDIKTAAHMAMKPFGGTDFGGSEIKIQDPECKHTGEANGGLDTVTIDATYTCGIPLAKSIVCSSGPKPFSVTAQFPHQGAEYELEQ
jgi:hypothetical protein